MNAYLIGAAVLSLRPNALAPVEDDSDEAVAERVVSEMEAAQSAFDAPALRPYEVADEPDEETVRYLRSELPNVSDECWTRFVLACKVQGADEVSPYGEIGMFALKPRRLEDLGLMANLSKSGRVWTGDWVAPLTEKAFLSSPKAQYKVFSCSMRLYVEGLDDGSIDQPDVLPDEMTMSGALALLHRWGPNALVAAQVKDAHFPHTQALYDACNGLF